MIDYPFNLNIVDKSWHKCLDVSLDKLDKAYLQQISTSNEWLPGPEKVLNAFSQPMSKVNYILFGESPYPRRESANGYAFWDQAVTELWSETGLSKKVNRATSLRNILKMLLVAEGLLDTSDTSQPAIAKLNKKHLIQTNTELFTNFLNHGFLLLNTTLVLQTQRPHIDARAWSAFMQPLLECLLKERPEVKFILLGNIANTIDKLLNNHPAEKLYAEHPYNLSFIGNKEVLDFFRPFHLLLK